MNIRPIRTEDDYKAACNRVGEIFHAEPGSKEDDELEILIALVDAYEEKYFPLEMPNPIEAIKIQMENLGISRKELMDSLKKSSGRISDILNCRRALTLADIRILSKLSHISVEVLSQDYPLEKVPANKSGNAFRSAVNG
jgi:HTH-type transcriptional regulator/antitoxin HigA